MPSRGRAPAPVLWVFGLLAAAAAVVTACSPDGGPGAAAPPPPTAGATPTTSAIEPRDPAVASTTTPARSPAPSVPARAVDGDLLCHLLADDDLAALGPGFVAAATGQRCRWTEPTGGRALEIASSALDQPPLAAVQRYLADIGRDGEPEQSLAFVEAGLVVDSTATRTLLVVFVGDVRLDFDVPAARDLAVGLARAAVDRLGPREAVD